MEIGRYATHIACGEQQMKVKAMKGACNMWIVAQMSQYQAVPCVKNIWKRQRKEVFQQKLRNMLIFVPRMVNNYW